MFGIYSPTLMLFGNVFVAAALVIGGYAVLGGTMQVGTLLALIIYANRVFEPIMTLSEFYNLFQSAFSALEKISGFWRSVRRCVRLSTPCSGRFLRVPHAGEVEFQKRPVRLCGGHSGAAAHIVERTGGAAGGAGGCYRRGQVYDR